MRLPTEKEIRKLLDNHTVTAAKAPPGLDVRGSGDFRLGEWVAKIKKAAIDANPIKRFHYIRLTQEGLDKLKEQLKPCLKEKNPNDPPWLDTFYGIPLVLKGSKQDDLYIAQGWKAFDPYE